MVFKASAKFDQDLMREVYYIGSLSQLLLFLLEKNDELDKKIIKKK